MSDFWTEQMDHKRTRGYYESLKKLIVDLDIKGDILEIGLDVGISARAFLERPEINLTDIDPGEVDIGIAQISAMNTGNRWIFHHQKSDDYFSTCNRLFDFIYIDGDHVYEQVNRDVINGWKFLKAGGYLIGHDILHQGNWMGDYGVFRAFAEFIKEYDLKAEIWPPYPGLITVKKV